MMALYYQVYNFVREHQSLAGHPAKTPAMAAGVTDTMWTFAHIGELVDGSRRLKLNQYPKAPLWLS